MAVPLMKSLHSLAWKGAVSMLAGTAMFAGKSRDAVFAEMAARLVELVEIGQGQREGLELAVEA
jgi:hypothetical protein